MSHDTHFSVERHDIKGHVSQINLFSVVKHDSKDMCLTLPAQGVPFRLVGYQWGTFLDLSGYPINVHMFQINPFPVERPRYHKRYTLGQADCNVDNSPPHPTPKGWGGELSTHLFCFVYGRNTWIPLGPRGQGYHTLRNSRSEFPDLIAGGCNPQAVGLWEWWWFMTSVPRQPLPSCAPSP